MLTLCQMFLLALTSGLLLMTSQCEAWSQWVDGDNDSRSCARTDQPCTRSIKCCNPDDICITSAKRNGARLGYCTRMVNMGMYKGKAARLPCTTSQECDDGCCREYRKHRVGRVLICGTPSNDFTTFNCV